MVAKKSSSCSVVFFGKEFRLIGFTVTSVEEDGSHGNEMIPGLVCSLIVPFLLKSSSSIFMLLFLGLLYVLWIEKIATEVTNVARMNVFI